MASAAAKIYLILIELCLNFSFQFTYLAIHLEEIDGDTQPNDQVDHKNEYQSSFHGISILFSFSCICMYLNFNDNIQIKMPVNAIIAVMKTSIDLVSSPGFNGFMVSDGCKDMVMRGMMKMKNGAVAKASIRYTELIFRFASTSLIADRNAKLAPYIINRINIDVSRGSQFQNDPQVRCANMEPVTIARMQNRKPSSLDATANISSREFRFKRYLTPNTIDRVNAKKAIQAWGT